MHMIMDEMLTLIFKVYLPLKTTTKNPKTKQIQTKQTNKQTNNKKHPPLKNNNKQTPK